MNINLRALVFGVAVAAVTTLTIESVVAAEVTRPVVVRLAGIEVFGHRDVVSDDAVVHLEPIVVTAHKTTR